MADVYKCLLVKVAKDVVCKDKSKWQIEPKPLLIAPGNDAVKEEVVVLLKILSAWVLIEATCHASASHGVLLCFGYDLRSC